MKFYKPETLEAALSIRRDETVLPFAGGTDIMVKGLRGANLVPGIEVPVLYLSGIDELKEWRNESGTLYIGACLTYSELLSRPDLPVLLKKSILEIGSPGVRNLGTLGGNICNASPAGDTLPVLYVLDADVRVADATSTRDVPLKEFIIGPGKTILKPHELVLGVVIPAFELPAGYYRKVGTRKANALSKLSCAGAAAISGDKILDFRVALGAVAPTVIRPFEVEKHVCSLTLPELKRDSEVVIDTVSSLIHPIDDQRSSAAYRTITAERLLSQFIQSLR